MLDKSPSTALRTVPLPCKCRGGLPDDRLLVAPDAAGLTLEQPAVGAAIERQKRRVRAVLGDPALVEHQDPVEAADGRPRACPGRTHLYEPQFTCKYQS